MEERHSRVTLPLSVRLREMRTLWRGRGRFQKCVAVSVSLGLLWLLATARVVPLPLSSCLADPLAAHPRPQDVTLYFKPRAQPLNEPVTRYLLHPAPGTCSAASDLLLLVPSPPADAHVREAVRQTWGSAATGGWPGWAGSERVGLVFVLGRRRAAGAEFNLTALTQEAARHGDLLLADFEDSYRNLTRKILAGLHWASRHCCTSVSPSSLSSHHQQQRRRPPGADNCVMPAFVLKADQDTFVHVPRLLELLARVRKSGHAAGDTVLGQMLCSEPVVRDPESKVMVEASLYPFAHYPPYARGGTYALAGPLLARLVNASRYLPLLPVEDAFINGVVARALRVQHIDVPGVMAPSLCPLSPCIFVGRRMLSAASVGPDMARGIWRALQAGPDHCRRTASVWTRACVWLNQQWE